MVKCSSCNHSYYEAHTFVEISGIQTCSKCGYEFLLQSRPTPIAPYDVQINPYL